MNDHDTFFKVFATVDAFEKSGAEYPMRIGGICSTGRLDRQGEKIVQKGLDFTRFIAEGWFNDNHGQSSTDVVGYPTDARYVQKGEQLPNGQQAREAGWWVEGYLIGEKGRQLWELTRSLSKSPRKLGFSIEGSVVERKKGDSGTIARAAVRNVAITHCPVAFGTELVALAKALSAGHGVGTAEIGTGPGDGAPLRTESLEGGVSVEEDDEDDVIDLDDLLKAEGPEAVDLVDYVSEWAAAIAKTPSTNPKRMSKAQAFEFVSTARPDLTPGQVYEIIEKSTTGGSHAEP